jgi:acyl carrier protein
LGRLSPEARPKFLLDHLRQELAAVLRMEETLIDPTAALTSFGVDSLMAFEFKLRIDRSLKIELPMDQVSAGITLGELTELLLHQSLGLKSTAILQQENGPGEVASAREQDEIQREQRPFLRVVTTSSSLSLLETLTFDAASLLYIPDRVSTVGGYSHEEVTAMFGTDPFVSHLYETSFGRIGVITLPIRGADLFGSERLPALIYDAGKLARKHGAKCISLTGLIPSATDYGRAVAGWLNTEPTHVTTGHATTTAAVALNLEHLLHEAGRDLASEHLAMLGLGSIGKSCLALLLDVLPHPASLTLCDVFGNRDELDAMAHVLRTRYGYSGPIRILTSESGMPDGLYEATTILAAVSVPEVVDVLRLHSGTILVDDSYPPAFHVGNAIRRLESDNDILFGNAGIVRLPDPVQETVFLPPGTENAVERFGIDSFQRELARQPHELTACILSSVLTDRYEGFSKTIGLTDPADALRHYRAVRRLGITAARPQCGTYFVPDDAVLRFRREFGESRTIEKQVSTSGGSYD